MIRLSEMIYTEEEMQELKDALIQEKKENKYRRSQVKELKAELKAKKELLRYYQKKKNKFILQTSKGIQQ